jgi:hypothetical protein
VSPSSVSRPPLAGSHTRKLTYDIPAFYLPLQLLSGIHTVRQSAIRDRQSVLVLPGEAAELTHSDDVKGATAANDR